VKMTHVEICGIFFSVKDAACFSEQEGEEQIRGNHVCVLFSFRVCSKILERRLSTHIMHRTSNSVKDGACGFASVTSTKFMIVARHISSEMKICIRCWSSMGLPIIVSHVPLSASQRVP